MFNFELFRIRMTSPWWRAPVADWQSRHPGSVPWRGAPLASPPPPRRSAPWTPASSQRTGCCPATTDPDWTSKCPPNLSGCAVWWTTLELIIMLIGAWEANHHRRVWEATRVLIGPFSMLLCDESRLIWASARALAVNSPMTLVGRIGLHRIIINCHLHSFERLQISFRVKTGHS